MTERSRSAPLGGDEAVVALIVVVGVLCAVVWSGAQVASLLSTGHFVRAGLGDAMSAAIRLPDNAVQPAGAWSDPAVSGHLPGPLLYWASTALVGVVELAGAVWMWLKLFSSSIGTKQRTRLGVQVGARLAARADLTPLIVAGPEVGRFVFGCLDQRTLLATENGQPSKRRRPNKRVGRRTAVAMIGPSQSGKTSAVVAGILDWNGPALLSSVKNDLFDETIARRRQLGDVYVFDPMRTIPRLPDGVKRVGWSPLHAARTVSGAIEISTALLDAAPKDGVTNGSYWTSKGQALLWPMLFAAAHDPDLTMADVVRWLSSQDGNPQPPTGGPGGNGAPQVDPDQFGEIRTILRHYAATGEERVAIQAKHTLDQFDGFFRLDHRTRSDIYSTSQTLVQPWEDPNISYASSPAVGPVADLRQVLEGANTLYVCTPLKDASRYSVVFGGLLGALLRDQAYDVANRYGKRLPGLLCIIDEAGNTPLRWLPEVASTCSGIGVQLVTVWQSKAQIDATYQNQADPMLTNHATKIFFAGASDTSTLRYVTYLGGEEEVTQRTANADAHFGGYRRGVGDSTVHRPLLPAEVLRQAEPGHAILFHATHPPAHIQGRWIGDDARLARIAAGAEPKPEIVLDDELKAALEHDATPPIEVLRHLVSSRAASHGGSSPEPTRGLHPWPSNVTATDSRSDPPPTALARKSPEGRHGR
ncbi:MAG: type IV secretory system conjugative DNA transfer family protein [Acidimicrobiales bacterium]|nr:type IV secretory system conjugative DNA transfer family protein [Acidimicrobiales bacterium]